VDRSALRTAVRKYYQFALFPALFILLQTLLGAFARVDHSYGNVRWYFNVAARMHDRGFFNIWTPYPPVFPAFLYFATSFIETLEGFFAFWKALNVVLVSGITFMVFWALKERSLHRAVLAAFGYALINATWNSRLTIGFFFDQFDYIPVLLLLIAMYLLVKKRFTASAVVCGVGAMTKLFPAVILLIALFMPAKRRKVGYLVIFAVTCFAILVPYIINDIEPMVSWYYFTAGRGSWETVWQYPEIRFPPVPDPDLLTYPARSTARPYAWLNFLTAASMLGYLTWRRLKSVDATVPQQTLCLLLAFLIFSKGVSSYFIFWVFPLLFLCYSPLRSFVLCLVFLVVANFEFFRDTHWISIWTRHSLFVGLLIHQILTQARKPPPTEAHDLSRPGQGLAPV
jgi:hypothetical protein